MFRRVEPQHVPNLVGGSRWPGLRAMVALGLTALFCTATASPLSTRRARRFADLYSHHQMPPGCRSHPPAFASGLRFGRQEFRAAPWLVPEKGAEQLDEQRLCELATSGDFVRVVVCADKNAVSYAADTVFRYLMGLADRPFSLHLATGATTEPLRIALGQPDWPHHYSRLTQARLPIDLLEWLPYWDDYRWGAGEREAWEERLGRDPSYLAEYIRTVIDPLGLDPQRLLGPPVDVQRDARARDLVTAFRGRLEQVGLATGQSRILVAIAGIGLDGHWGFNNSSLAGGSSGLLRRDAQVRLPLATRAQNCGHFLTADENPPDPRLLDWIATYRLYTERSLSRFVSSGLPGEFAHDDETHEARLHDLLRLADRVPEIALTEGTGSFLRRSPYLTISMANGSLKRHAFKRAIAMPPNAEATASASQFTSVLWIADLAAAELATRTALAGNFFYFAPDEKRAEHYALP